MIMDEGDHMILLNRFSKTIPIANGKFLDAGSYKQLQLIHMQQPSISPALHLTNSPSPNSPGGHG